MSEQELAQCETMLKGLLLPDNTARNKFQAQLQNCLSNIKNKESLSLYCSILLLKSTDLNVQTYWMLVLDCSNIHVSNHFHQYIVRQHFL